MACSLTCNFRCVASSIFKLLTISISISNSLAVAATLAGFARAERPLLADELPPDLDGVGIVERLGDEVPRSIRFTDDAGNAVTVGDYFQGERPVILTLNYYRCPMLCDITLNGLVDGMR